MCLLRKYQLNQRFEDHNSSRKMTECLNKLTILRIAALLNMYEVAKMKSKVLTNHISVQELTKFCTENLWEVQLVLNVNLVDFSFLFDEKGSSIANYQYLRAADRATVFCTEQFCATAVLI